MLYYDIEHMKYNREGMIRLTFDDAEFIFNKLIRHFKLTNITLHQSNKRDGGKFVFWKKSKHLPTKILLGKSYSMSTVCHEIAHAITYYNDKKVGHNKHHVKAMNRVIKYVRSKQYWGLERPADMSVNLNDVNAVVEACIGGK